MLARPTAFPIRLALIALAVLLIASSAFVGFVGSHDGFDWELASIFGTALGTTLLALATGWVAYSTRAEVRATQQLAKVARDDQVARDRPVVLVEWCHHEPGLGGGWLRFQLVNVGLGPALRLQVGAEYVPDARDEGGGEPKVERVTISALSPNERTVDAQLSVTYPAPNWGSLMDRRFRVTGTYEDRAGRGDYEIEQPIESEQRTTWRQGPPGA